MRKALATVGMLAVLLAGSSVYADCGHCGKEGAAHACTMKKAGDGADVLNQASAALKDSNPELAKKVQAIADDCCKHQLHEVKG